VSKEKMDEKKELVAHVTKAGLTHSPLLCLFIAQRLASTPTQRDWIVDSGASAHMCSERHLFDSYQPLWPPQLIGLGDGRTIPATGTGDVRLLVYIGDSHQRVLTLRDVCHVPVLDKNLLSVSCLARHNLQVIFGMRSCQITNGQETIGTTYKKDALYILSTARHLNEATYAKKAPPQSEDPRPLHTTYLNVCGPVDTATWTGNYYFTTFVDTYSHHVVVRLMKSKGEILKFTREYLDHTETITGKHAAHFRMADIGNGTFDTLQAYLNTKGISCEVANEHTPGIESAAAQTASRLLETAQMMLTDTDWISGHWGDILLHAAHTLNRAPTPLIAGNCTLREMFTKKKLLVRMLRALKSRVRRNVPNDNHPAYGSRTLNRRPAIASTNGRRGSELQTDELNGEHQRPARAGMNGLNHLAVDEIHLIAEEMEGLAHGIGPHFVQGHSNSPVGLRVPTSAVESSDGLTARVPGWKRQEEAVNGSVKPSDPSDRSRSRHQGDLTPKLKFAGEMIKTDVRSDEKRRDGDRHTYQRAQSQLLDPPTRNVPPIGKMDDLEGPAWRRGGDPHGNDLETCKNGCQRTIKEGKGQLNANGNESLPSSVETDDDKSCNMDRSKIRAPTESGDPSHMSDTRDTSTRGLTAPCNASGHRDFQSTATSNKIYFFPSHSFGETDDPHDHNAVKTDDLPTTSTTNMRAY